MSLEPIVYETSQKKDSFARLASHENLELILKELQPWRTYEVTKDTLFELSAKEVLKSLIRQRTDSNESFAHFAARAGNLELLDAIANYEDALVNREKPNNCSAVPTHFYDTNQKDETPLTLLKGNDKVKDSNTRTAKAFRAQQGDVYFTQDIAKAAESGNFEWFSSMIEKSPKLISAKHALYAWTFLHYAVRASGKNPDFNNPQMIFLRKLFAEEKYRDLVNINARDKWGQTPLYIACEKNDAPMIKFLLKCQADFWVYDNYKNLPSKQGNHELMNSTVEYKWARRSQREGFFSTEGTSISKDDADAIWIDAKAAWQKSADKESFMLIAEAMKTQLKKGYNGSSNAERCKRFIGILDQPTAADKALLKEKEFKAKEEPSMFSTGWISDIWNGSTNTKEHWQQSKDDAAMKIALWEGEFDKEGMDPQKQLLILHEVIKHFRKEVKADLLEGKVKRVGGGFLTHLGYFSNQVQQLAMLNELSVQTKSHGM